MILPISFGLGSSLCALGVGTWPRAERGRVAGPVASGIDSGTGVEALDVLRGWAGGLTAFGATDSLRGRDEAAVVAGCVGGGAVGVAADCMASDATAVGVGGSLGSFGVVLVTFGVLGPAGASGTWTVMPSLACLLDSGMGTGVLAMGESSADAGVSLGVERGEAGVRDVAGDVRTLDASALSCDCKRGRFGSGCLDSLSSVATDAARGVSEGFSVAGGGETSRLRLLEVLAGRGSDFFFWDAGVAAAAAAGGGNVNSLSPSAA